MKSQFIKLISIIGITTFSLACSSGTGRIIDIEPEDVPDVVTEVLSESVSEPLLTTAYLTMAPGQSCSTIQDRLVADELRYIRDQWSVYCETGQIGDTIGSVASDSGESSRYTQQNSQAPGVLEPDQIMTNGAIVAKIHLGQVHLTSVEPSGHLKSRSTIELDGSGSILSLILSDDQLFLFAERYIRGDGREFSEWSEILEYDLSNPETPRLVTKTRHDHSLVSARLSNSGLTAVYKSDNFYGMYGTYNTVWGESDKEFYCSETNLERHLTEQYNILLNWSFEDQIAELSTTIFDEEGDARSIKEIKTPCSDIQITLNKIHPGLVSVVNIDVNEKQSQQNTLMAPATVVYQNQESLVLAGDLDLSKSSLHHFTIRPEGLSYQGVAIVDGRVPSQWAMNVKGEHLAVFTELRVKRVVTDIHLSSFLIEDEGLTPLSQIQNIMSGESVFAARFENDRAYLVTYDIIRNWDPLFVFDTNDWSNMKLLGSLEMPGYSGYLESLDDGLLLGIGQGEATCWSATACVGDNLKVSLFDVSSDSDPEEVAQTILEPSEDFILSHEINHLAVHHDREMKRLYVPINAYLSAGMTVETESILKVLERSGDGYNEVYQIELDEDRVGFIDRSLIFSSGGSEVLVISGSNGLASYEAHGFDPIDEITFVEPAFY